MFPSTTRRLHKLLDWRFDENKKDNKGNFGKLNCIKDSPLNHRISDFSVIEDADLV
jgi:hypothetical protein